MRLPLVVLAIAVGGCVQEPLEVSASSSQKLIAAEARRQGVPEGFALRIAKIESGQRCDAVGPRTRSGRAQGPLQIMPGSARALGHSGGPLNNCGAGLHYGMKHLAMCYRLAGGNQPLAARCHLAGPGGMHRRTIATERYVHIATR